MPPFPTILIKLLLQNHLGNLLKRARKRRQLTQGRLASEANLSVPTIRLLERGKGNLTSWHSVLCAMKLELKGRNLPPANTLGRQIALLRKRHKLSQRALASIVGTTPPTLVRIERENTGRLDVMDRVLTVLGSGPVLVPKGTAPSFFSHAGNSSGHHGWQTPKWLLANLYKVFGTFDLDPCSPTQNRRTAPVRAKVYYTMEDDGLSLPWHGKVFVNPPYGRTLRLWTTKARMEASNGNVKTVVALVPARTDTRWWHTDVAGPAEVFFLQGRLCFDNSGQSAPFPSALVVWGPKPAEVTALKQILPDAWQA